ncbi:MAG: SDR family NAD(P)-dependent oxidoreductase [Phycisphaerales bacterium]|nr:SDR family NAD(P)-dependent oxidoreductase [Phycisphaerales bacterium]MCB9856240.1 SDR family NAD(P)-dependent oxidoreductase [Phycisphaerales bacterium]MCB9863321.1 SDR family NAD(P)-dependent oxidoreductase [Phycisphaerales bacterium]
MSLMDREQQQQSGASPVAIVGMGCLFPGARNLQEFWRVICEGRDCIGDVPATHWSAKDYLDADPKAPDMTYSARGGFLPTIDFDPTEFGIPPTILEATDTTQLLSLIAAKAALEDAGYDEQRDFRRDRVSVVVGVTGTQELVLPLSARLGHPIWRKALADAGIVGAKADEVVERIADGYVPWQENSFPGLLGNVVAGRISNRLNLQGTNCAVDAACASSLSAIHLATMELQTGRCDMAVAGGADTLNDIFMYMCFSKTPALSPTGDARPFSDKADGTVLGEGVAFLTLKRLADAERDGDRVYAVIRGIGTSSDGRSQSIYAPHAAGQERCLRDAYTRAGVGFDSVGLIEAHGTGTKVGDATEFEALKRVFGGVARRDGKVAIGSIKSQIGHTKAAAGVAGLMKAALAVHHGVLPPTIKVDGPNPKMGIDESPFYVSTELRPWVNGETTTRRAGVSAFGFGGSNFHAVLESSKATATQAAWDGSVQIFAFSGATREAIGGQLDGLRSQATGKHWNGAALAYAAQQSRHAFDGSAGTRLLLVIGAADDLVAIVDATKRQLIASDVAAWSTTHAHFGSGSAVGKLALLFPGQGSQYVGMAQRLACMFPEMRAVLRTAEGLLRDDGVSLSRTIYPEPTFATDGRRAAEAALTRTDVAQPALGAVSLGMLRVLERFGVRANAFAGHSYGELVALCAAGRYDAATLLKLSRLRGRLMADCDDGSGAMLAVKASSADVEAMIRDERLDVVLANRNGPAQVVLSGDRSRIASAAEACKRRGWGCAALRVAGAFHSPLVAGALAPFRNALGAVDFSAGCGTVYANTTGQAYPEETAACRTLLAEQLARPVDFVGEVTRMRADGVATFVEVGPKSVLSRLTASIADDASIAAMAMDASDGRTAIRDLATVLCGLAARGHAVDLTAWEAPVREPRVPKMVVPMNGANIRTTPRKEIARVEVSGATGGEETLARVSGATSEREVQPADAGAFAGEACEMGISHPQAIDHRDAAHEGSELLRATHRRAPTPEGVGHSALPGRNATAACLPLGASMAPGTAHRAVAPESEKSTRRRDGSGIEGARRSAVGMSDDSVNRQDGMLPEAIRLVQQGLTAMQQLQQQTAEAHQRFLAGQEQAQRAFQAMIEGQQRLVQSTVYGRGLSGDGRSASGAALGGERPVARASDMPTLGVGMAPDARGFSHERAAPANKPPVAPVLPADAGALAGMDSRGDGREMGISHQQTTLGDKHPVARAIDMPTLGVGMAPEPVARASDMPTLGVGMAPGEYPAARDGEYPVARGGVSREWIGEQIVGVVCDKTGYPAEMIELGMDLEADLGVDSIKRVEIIAALEEAIPEFGGVQPDHMGSIRTLAQIVEFVAAGLETSNDRGNSHPEAGGGEYPGVRGGALGDKHPVARANGMPTLGVGMAPGAQVTNGSPVVGTAHPTNSRQQAGMPTFEGKHGTQKRDGVDAVDRRAPTPEGVGHPSVDRRDPTAEGVGHPTTLGVGMAPGTQVASGSPVVGTAHPTNSHQLSGVLLEVVAELTGYPQDMLELGMDMEADLGIDSIKRVEILAAVEGRLPEMPPVKPEQMGAMRTLAQIVEYFATESRIDTGTSNSSGETMTQVELAPEASTDAAVEFDPRRRVLTLVELPQATCGRLPIADGHEIWITDDGNGLSAALVQAFEAAGRATRLVSLDPSFDVGAAKVGALIIVAPSAHAIDSTWEPATEGMLKRAFEMTKALTDPILKALHAGGALVATIARMDGAFGLLDGDFDPAQGGLAALPKTVMREWEGVCCRALDVAVDWKDARAAAEVVVRELSCDGPVEVGLDASHRRTVELERARVTAGSPAIAKGDVVVVTGGARGVTAEAALALARRHQPTLVLMGRTQVDEKETAWMAGLSDERDIKQAIKQNAFPGGDKPTPQEVKAVYRDLMAQREIRENLGRIRAAGSEVRYVPVDVCDAAAMRAALDAAKRAYGPVRGVIHGAGRIEDKRIQQKTSEQFAAVLDTKVLGLRNVLDAIDLESLRHIVMFSSVSGRCGNVGQIDYAMANEVLNKISQRLARRLPHCRVVSMNWGPWDGGMVTPGLKREFENHGVELIPLDAGAELVAEELSNADDGSVEVVLGYAFEMPKAKSSKTASAASSIDVAFEREVDVASHPFLASHVIDGRAVLPAAMISEWMAHAALHANPGLRLQGMDNFRLFKGVVFSGEARTLRFHASNAMRSGDVFDVQVELRSVADDGSEVLHARATAVLTAGALAMAPTYAAPASLMSESFDRSKDAIYGQMLFHGEALHAIERIDGIGSGGLVAAIRASDAPSAWMREPLRSDWLTNPLGIDAAYQAAIVWCREKLGAPSLPAAFGSYRQYRDWSREPVSVAIGVTRGERNKMVCDVYFVAAGGGVVAKIDGYECTVDANLARAFERRGLMAAE